MYHVDANHSLVYFKRRTTSPQLWADSDLVSVKLVLHISEVCSPPALHFCLASLNVSNKNTGRKSTEKAVIIMLFVRCQTCIYVLFIEKFKIILEDVNIYFFTFVCV